jgi:hypothetical protein
MNTRKILESVALIRVQLDEIVKACQTAQIAQTRRLGKKQVLMLTLRELVKKMGPDLTRNLPFGSICCQDVSPHVSQYLSGQTPYALVGDIPVAELIRVPVKKFSRSRLVGVMSVQAIREFLWHNGISWQ